MADVLDIDNAEDFEVDDDGDRTYFWVLALVKSHPTNLYDE